MNYPFNSYCIEQLIVGTLYLVENAKEIVGPLGSWSDGSICTDERVVAKGSLVHIVEGAHFLIGRVLPGNKYSHSEWMNSFIYLFPCHVTIMRPIPDSILRQ